MSYIRRLLSLIQAYIPSRLPVGLSEFHAWAESIIALLPPGFEKVPVDELKWVIATAIQHLDATKARVPKIYFLRLLHKAAASQVASQVFQDIKNKQLEEKAAREAAEAAKKLEATPPEASSGQKEN